LPHFFSNQTGIHFDLKNALEQFLQQWKTVLRKNKHKNK